MLYSLFGSFLFLVASTFATGDHSGHQHLDETIADCECTTGITTADLDLNCDDHDFSTNLAGLQTYLRENDCSQYCMNLMLMETTEAAFRCYQVFSLVVQYHDYCSSGTVNETLFHEYLESCPDCYQNHLYVAGAPECDAALNCTDKAHQIEDVEFVLDECITACPDDVVHENEHESCTEIWQHVEGYHRMCAHGDLTVQFEQLYDQAAFSSTVCTDTHCNVPWEINGTANCSDSNNMQYMMLREMYGDLDISEVVTVTPSPTKMDHSGHQHTSDSIADCECTTGITTEELDVNCDDDDFSTNLEALETYLQDNECSQYCMNLMLMETTEAAFKCYQVFSIIVQYHDYCSSGTVDEELFHEYLEACPDCYQNHYQYPGAEECDPHLNCTDNAHQKEDVEFVLENCINACPDDIVHENEHESCVEIWKHVEGYHRMCAHTDLTVEFEELYDQAAFEKTICQGIECNVPWEINGTANCSASKNMQYNMLREMYGDLVIADIVEIVNDSGSYQLIVKMVGFVSILSILFT